MNQNWRWRLIVLHWHDRYLIAPVKEVSHRLSLDYSSWKAHWVFQRMRQKDYIKVVRAWFLTKCAAFFSLGLRFHRWVWLCCCEGHWPTLKHLFATLTPDARSVVQVIFYFMQIMGDFFQYMCFCFRYQNRSLLRVFLSWYESRLSGIFLGHFFVFCASGSCLFGSPNFESKTTNIDPSLL